MNSKELIEQAKKEIVLRSVEARFSGNAALRDVYALELERWQEVVTKAEEELVEARAQLHDNGCLGASDYAYDHEKHWISVEESLIERIDLYTRKIAQARRGEKIYADECARVRKELNNLKI